MNILFFCSNPVDGGTARIFYETVNCIKKLTGNNNVIVCVDEDNPVKIYKKINDIIYLHVISEERMFASYYSSKGFKKVFNHFIRKIKYRKIKKKNIQCMKEVIEKEKIDVVVVHNGGYSGDDLCNQMIEAAYHCNVNKRIMVFHSDMKKNFFRMLQYFVYDMHMKKWASDIITVSNFTKKRIERSSFIGDNIQVIYNGLSDRRVMSADEKHKCVQFKEKKFNVLMIGNFLENKGQERLIEAANMANDKEISYTIIGNIYDKNYFDLCEDKIERYKLHDQFDLIYGIYNAYEYIDLFDALVVPSIYDESFGLTSVEAMIACKPVIAFDCGGIPEVVEDGITGLIVPVGDAEKMAHAIIELKANPDKAKKMGNAGYKRYKEMFSIEAMQKKYIQKIVNEN